MRKEPSAWTTIQIKKEQAEKLKKFNKPFWEVIDSLLTQSPSSLSKPTSKLKTKKVANGAKPSSMNKFVMVIAMVPLTIWGLFLSVWYINPSILLGLGQLEVVIFFGSASLIGYGSGELIFRRQISASILIVSSLSVITLLLFPLM